MRVEDMTRQDLIAEVKRLREELAAVRKAWAKTEQKHSFMCDNYDGDAACSCGTNELHRLLSEE